MRYFLALLLLFGCGKSVSKSEKEINEIVFKTARELNQEKELKFIGLGSSMMQEIRMVSLSLVSHKSLNIDGARKLITCSVDKLLKNINESKEIREKLIHFPFTADDVEVRISFNDLKGQAFKPPFIAFVSAIKGEIAFYVEKEGHYSLLHKESFVTGQN